MTLAGRRGASGGPSSRFCWRCVPGRAEIERNAASSDSAELSGLLAGRVQADLESFYLAEPAAFGGLADPLVQAGDDLGEPHALLRVDAEHRAADAP